MNLDTNMFQQLLEIGGSVKDIVVGALKPVGDTLDVLKKVKDLTGKSKNNEGTDTISAEVRELVTELAEKVASAREAHAAQKIRVAALLEEVSRLQNFETDRSNYVLVEIFPRSFAYRTQKPGEAGASSAHFCVHCFEQAKRVVTLQLKQRDFNVDTLKCSTCSGEVFQANELRAEVRSAPARPSWFDR